MIPKKVKIGSQKWDVVLTPALNEEMGTSDVLTQTIHIQASLCEQQQEVVLLHEVIHACCRYVGLDDGDGKTYGEEEFIARIDSCLHSALKQNKLF